MMDPTILLNAIAFVDLLAVGMIVPLIPGAARALGASHLEVGLLGSLYAAAQLPSGPMLGSLSDVKGRKPVLIVTLLVCSVTYTMLGLTQSVHVMLMFRAVLGIFKQTQTLSRAMVGDYVHDVARASAAYGRMNAVSGAGITLGPLLGGHLAEEFPRRGFVLVAAATGLCFLLNAGLVASLPAPPEEKTAAKRDGERPPSVVRSVIAGVQRSYSELRGVRWSRLGDIFLYKGLIGFAMGVYYSVYSTLLRESFGLSPRGVGAVISLQGVVGAVTSYFMGTINSYYRDDAQYRRRHVHVFAVLCAALGGLALARDVPVYAACLVPLAVGNAAGRHVTLEAALARGGAAHRGALLGAASSVRSAAGALAPLAAGALAHYSAPDRVVFASLASTAAGLLLAARALLAPRTRTKRD